MNSERKKLTYLIVSSTKKEGHHDIISSDGEYMATFKGFQDCCDYIGSYLIHKDYIDGKCDPIYYEND